MTRGASSGWQTALCDLAIILFMITAAAVSEARVGPQEDKQPVGTPLVGEAVAVWRGAPGGLSLTDWLAREGADPRLQLTIVAGPKQAQDALDLTKTAGRPARLLIEPEAGSTPFATLAFDHASAVARPLRDQGATQLAQEEKR